MNRPHMKQKFPMNRQAKTRHSRLGAILSMELILVLPIMLTVILAIVEFAMIMQARGSVVEATRVAGRVAVQSHVDQRDVELAARRALGNKLGHAANVDVVLGKYPGDRVAVGVRVPMIYASPDFLFWVGLSHRGQQLAAVSEFVKE